MSVETIPVKGFGPSLTFLVLKTRVFLKYFIFFFLNQNCLANIGRDFCFIRNEDTMATIIVVCILDKKPIFHWT